MLSYVWRWIGVVGLSALLAACSAADALNVLIPSDGYMAHVGQAYGSNPRQVLDVFEPTGAAPGNGRTVVVFLYGGSWRNGKRENYRFVGEALSSKGYVAIIPDYRIFPEVTYPGFVEDAALALRWANDNAARFGGNKDRIVLMGHSAGAHIAALAMLDPQFLKAVDLPSTTVKGLVGLAGPYSFNPLGSAVGRAVFSHLANPDVARPVIFAKNATAPMFLLHGADDSTVKPADTVDMAMALKTQGQIGAYKLYPKVGHIGVVLALAKPFRSTAPTLQDSAAFIDGLFDASSGSANAAQ